MKTLYIMRHGQAQPQAQTDAARRLTPRGARDVERMAETLAGPWAALDQIWVSPYQRARETAAIVVRGLNRSLEPVTTEWLTPEAEVAKLCEQLQASGVERLLLVSHMPLVGELLHVLTGAEPGRYPMGTASVARLDLDEVVAADLARLIWLRHREDV